MAKRSQKPSTPEGDATTDPFDKLLAELSKHGQDIELGERLWTQLAAHGHEAIPAILDRVDGEQPFKLVDRALERILAATDPELLGHAAALLEASLGRAVSLTRRIAAIRAFPHGFRQDPRVHDRLLNIALDPGEDTAARAAALDALAEMKPRGPQAERLLAILDTDHEHWLSQDILREAVFLCLRRHALEIPSRQLLLRLEPLLTHPNAHLRRRTIELIGAFGDIDIIEHLFALPDAPLHRKEILDAVAAITSRPINILSMRPDAFEAFISRVLRRMGFQEVKLTRSSRDGGIDAECVRESPGFGGPVKEKVIVQCKRYATKPIDDDTLKDFVKAKEVHQAHHGIFITTSKYTSAAGKFAQSRKDIAIFAADDLVRLFDKEFATNRYTIRVHT